MTCSTSLNPPAKVPKRLAGILLCLLLANVLNYALGEWLDRQIPGWAPPVATVDGSTLNTSRYYEQAPDTTLALSADAETLLDFYTYLDQGGARNYANWRSARTDLDRATSPLRLQALRLADAANTGRYLSLLLLILTLLALLGGALKETEWYAPFLYLLIFGGTVGIYGNLAAPVFTATVVGFLLLYFVSLRLILPLYHTEWVRLMRPGLTFCCFLLAVMAWRGPELVDFWFWTSPLFRLFLVLVVLLTLFFHWSILNGILRKADLGGWFGVFTYAMPLGVSVLIPGIVLGLVGPHVGGALSALNYELALLPVDTVAGLNQESPFVLFFAGTVLLVVAGIGYSIKKISR